MTSPAHHRDGSGLPGSWDGARSTGLSTDFYEIRMAVSYLRRGMTGSATFSLFARRLPTDRGFLVCAGLADCLAFLQGFRFSAGELDYVSSAGFTAEDVAALAGLRFTGDVRAVPEGRLVFADEPMLEVTAPIPQAQLVETALVNLITFQSTVASKAARCRLAAPDADLVDFAARRTHGLEAAAAVARACAMVGFTGTSFVAAARRFGLRPMGTMAHSYVQAFADERSAFRAFATDFPHRPVFLVDTYDTLAGVGNAITVAGEAGLGDAFGVRLDSGDIASLAWRARRMLDAAGLPGVRIMASGGLDEFALARFVADGTPIDAYGIGTKLGVSADAPSLDSAYKLVDYDGRPVLKLSTGKSTLPGAKQVYRLGPDRGDVIALRSEPAPPGGDGLLVPVMRGGRRVLPDEDLAAARERFERDLAGIPAGARRLSGPQPVAVTVSPSLDGLSHRLRRAAATNASDPVTGRE